jgi:hypothetical protein
MTTEPTHDSRRRKRLAVLGVGFLVLVGGGIAFAAYLSTGAGSASATSSTAVNSVISPSSTGTPLYPGSSTPVTIGITNPNPYPARVTSISAGSSNATGTSGACTAGTVTTPAVTAPPTTVIPPNGTGSYTLTASMKADPDNSCQNQTFTLPLTAQLASAAS